MTTRKARLSADHVRALNMIDVSFYGIRMFFMHWQTSAEKKVTTAWKIYLDNLATDVEEWTEPQRQFHWGEREKQFGILLVAIAASVGYNFDEVHIKKQYRSVKTVRPELVEGFVSQLQGFDKLSPNGFLSFMA